MFLQTDPVETPHPNGAMAGLQTTVQRLGWFQHKWDVQLPSNFADDYRLQPFGVRHYKELIDLNYGRVPDERTDLWLERRNYLINCMRLVDAQFNRVLTALDSLELWKDTLVILTSDHGEMNGAHRMTQKGAIHFDEAATVNLTVCVPGGPQGRRTTAVGSHLDLAPTLLAFAGMTEPEIRARYPHLKGKSLKSVILHPDLPGPRGDAHVPGAGALFCWDGLHALDKDWALTGALQELTDMGTAGPHGLEADRAERLRRAGKSHGAPDLSKRTFFRAVVDGHYKLVRWFSPLEYADPCTLHELYAQSDVTLHDLLMDPGELENLGHPGHPAHDPAQAEPMLHKLRALVRDEIGHDRAQFDIHMFDTRQPPNGR